MAELTMARWVRDAAAPPEWVALSSPSEFPAPDGESVLLLAAQIDLESDPDETLYVPFLTEAERARMDRFLVAPARSRFLMGRGLMRSSLAIAAGCDAREIVLTEGEHGKPALDPDVHLDPVSFNLSHSGDRILIGLTRMGEVGVDVEHIRDRRMMAEILDRNFHPDEVAVIDDEQGFCQGWALKEAVVKAMGRGIGYPTAQFSVAPLLMGRSEADVSAGDQSWRCARLHLCEGYAAALALGIPRT